MREVQEQLHPLLYEHLQKERYVTISTVDVTGVPHVTAISWLVALSENRLAFAIDARSRLVQNIAKLPNAVVTVIFDGTTYAISGKVKIEQNQLDGIPIPLVKCVLEVTEVRDIMFYGSSMSSEPTFTKTYDAKKAEAIDSLVWNALRQQE
ncbi:pyridoxamine 5'-phosphate oxidase family protein [Mangrovibacillus cuniculi]|uniref:Pyridoxamine 5'-phosphate oxidase N-terminal domain-containing protein n=1 Tax=Mangrovibacillus cuniculi TaxID=2593652 RepID=A0A7S8HEX0_9BACI|nr:pyridoxamine 5'-phosphate oxidase family protein [Mangrovibacillus cuniculi]QPC46208.1 hypothetical protein G8O30_04160 [Mangrovibacillus cuniculi]